MTKEFSGMSIDQLAARRDRDIGRAALDEAMSKCKARAAYAVFLTEKGMMIVMSGSANSGEMALAGAMLTNGAVTGR